MPKDDALRTYAPLWAVLTGAGLTLTKSLTTRYFLDRRWRLEWTDVALALGGAFVSYLAFRGQYGYEDEEQWYQR